MRKPVAHGDHFNEQKIEAGGIEEGGEGVGGVVWGEGGFEGHLGWWNQVVWRGMFMLAERRAFWSAWRCSKPHVILRAS